MNDKTKIYLTASGVLGAILLVWAQLWNDLVMQYHNHKYSTVTADVSLTYVYLAIATSLIAFVIILCKQTVGSITKTFFGFSIVLTMILVLGSLFSAITKASAGTSTAMPSEFFVTLFSTDIYRQLSLYLIPVIIFVILLFIFRIRNQPINDTERGNDMSESEDGATKKDKVTIKPDDFVKLNNAYHTAIELWKLASDQIYSRFSAMLTANSIILAVIGLTISERISIPSWFVWVLVIAGILLCVVWLFFMAQGVHSENHYRRKAESFESQVCPNGEKIVIRVDDPKFKGFLSASFFVVYIFYAIYIAVICLLFFYKIAS